MKPALDHWTFQDLSQQIPPIPDSSSGGQRATTPHKPTNGPKCLNSSGARTQSKAHLETKIKAIIFPDALLVAPAVMAHL